MEKVSGMTMKTNVLNMANEAQRQAIETTEGPLLITAGPGTGKTFTLVQRAIYLMQKRGVRPEEIFLATFTEKAAKELLTRITNELATRDISANVNEMYVGTFHSLCLRIIKENLESSRLKKSFELMDSFGQKYTVFQNIERFKNIENLDAVLGEYKAWKWAIKISELANNLSEEMVDAERMSADKEVEISAIGRMLVVYHNLLEEKNLIDFSAIQTECFRLLNQNKDILKKLQEKLKYFMIDEYQDTNYVQEQLIFLLAGKAHNICVVGDDDQGLYRFRGATIRNILEFPKKFGKGVCRQVSLVENYRSNSGIVSFYNKWMANPIGFSWNQYRYSKVIKPYRQSKMKSPCVVKLSSDDDSEQWNKNILKFIKRLKKSGRLTDYNQLAFLFKSVKNEKVTRLADFLETNGIHVYSPRSNMFFQRREIMLALGCILLMFPKYVEKLNRKNADSETSKLAEYYKECIIAAKEYIKQTENQKLQEFIKECAEKHSSLTGTTDYAYSMLLYMLFRFEPFSEILSVDVSKGVVDIRPTRNLALLSQIIGKFEYLHRVDVLNGKYIDINTEKLFDIYLQLLYQGGINEYEDESEYAPSGCVSFLTIHQAKGMEFPIVFVGSLESVPRKNYDERIKNVEDSHYFHRSAFEPYEQMKYFDFWRLYYTAFSRAQDLLVLTCNKGPSKYFLDLYDPLVSVSNPLFDLSEFDFKKVKNVSLKDTFSLSSHISVYETCPLQYKFFKELEFMPTRENAMIFGMLVHETIEDIHSAALRKEEHLITKENIQGWMESNYNALAEAEHSYLTEKQRASALDQVLRYVDNQKGQWQHIHEAELDVSLVQSDYILKGKIDLIRGEGDTIELIDFKSEEKPDPRKMSANLEHYFKQLHIYAYLVEKRTGCRVSRMHLYYTSEKKDPMISIPYAKNAIEATVADFDGIAHKILRKDFSHPCQDSKVCKNCDFKFYCRNKV